MSFSTLTHTEIIENINTDHALQHSIAVLYTNTDVIHASMDRIMNVLP